MSGPLAGAPLRCVRSTCAFRRVHSAHRRACVSHVPRQQHTGILRCVACCLQKRKRVTLNLGASSSSTTTSIFRVWTSFIPCRQRRNRRGCDSTTCTGRLGTAKSPWSSSATEWRGSRNGEIAVYLDGCHLEDCSRASQHDFRPCSIVRITL